MHRWKNKVVVITGANSGIGAATAKRLADEGLIVVGLDRDITYLQNLSKEYKSTGKIIHFVQAHVEIEEEIVNAFKWIQENAGPVHVQINCAGVVHTSSLISGIVQSWKNTFNVNVVGLCTTTKEAIKNMMANGVVGHIININSYLGHTNEINPIMAIYSSSKHAVTALSENLRRELCASGHRIKVTSISPGIVATNLFTKLMENVSEKQVPNYLQPDDVVNCVVFALSMPANVDVTELTVRPVGDYLNEI